MCPARLNISDVYNMFVDACCLESQQQQPIIIFPAELVQPIMDATAIVNHAQCCARACSWPPEDYGAATASHTCARGVSHGSNIITSNRCSSSYRKIIN